MRAAPARRRSGGADGVFSSICVRAQALQSAGCFSLVLECVPKAVAAAVTAAVDIPTIGIGAGNACSGQARAVQPVVAATTAQAPAPPDGAQHSRPSLFATGACLPRSPRVHAAPPPRQGAPRGRKQAAADTETLPLRVSMSPTADVAAPAAGDSKVQQAVRQGGRGDQRGPDAVPAGGRLPGLPVRRPLPVRHRSAGGACTGGVGAAAPRGGGVAGDPAAAAAADVLCAALVTLPETRRAQAEAMCKGLRGAGLGKAADAAEAAYVPPPPKAAGMPR